MPANRKNKKGLSGQETETPAASKGEETRLRILDAARRVFTSVPYRGAGIRMIAEEAGVRYPLIVHYFKTKTALFEAVVAKLQTEILDSRPQFIDQLKNLPPDEAIHMYLKGVIRQGFNRPDAYRLIMLNLGETDALEKSLPGLDNMLVVKKKTISIVKAFLSNTLSEAETEKFMRVFTIIVSSFIGARVFHRRVLGINSDDEYETWVHSTINILFSPVMKALAEGRITTPPANVKWPVQTQTLRKAGEHDRRADMNRAGRPLNRGYKTRQRMITAARKVFSAHPYDAASIRMIGKEGGFDHTRIHHMFPTKADLFEAVARDVFSEFIQTAQGWQEGLEGLSPDQVFVHYLRKGLAYVFKHHAVLGLLIHNMAQYERYENLSGFVHMARAHTRMLELVQKSLPPGAPVEDIGKWLYTINMAGCSFAGAPDYPAGLMNMQPDSAAFRKKVFETLYSVFRPSLMNLVGVSEC